MPIFHWNYSNDDLVLIGLISLVIVFCTISIAITLDWLLEIFRSAKNDR